MTRVAYYVDSHGFGHSTRSVAIAEAFPDDWEVLFRTNAPAWLFEENGIPGGRVLPSPLDLHPVHSKGYRIDAGATLVAARAKLKSCEQALERESRWLRSESIDFAISDISPLAVHAARRAGIASYGISNFTWDWIYETLFEGLEGEDVVSQLREMMAEATLNFRLPLSEPETFPYGAVETPLTVRSWRRSREEARRYFGFDSERRFVLLTFGGFAAPPESLNRLLDYRPLEFVRVAPREVRLAGKFSTPLERDPQIPNLWNLTTSDLHHPDLVRAADAIVCKPGYGTLSEAMSAGTPMVCDSRHDFREFEPIRSALEDYPQVVFVEHEAILGFDLGKELDRVLAAPRTPWRGSMDGAEFIVECISKDRAP